MAISRIRVGWTGFLGAPGVSTFYSLDPDVDVPLIHGFFFGITSLLPADVTITVETSGDVLNETSGDITAGWTSDTSTPIDGTASGPYAAPVGAVVIWETGVVMDAHRLRGKTYLVPLSGDYFEADGTANPDKLAILVGAADSLAAENSLVVWHRPRAAREADGSKPAVTYRAGGYANVTAATVHDFAAVLTSRRD